MTGEVDAARGRDEGDRSRSILAAVAVGYLVTRDGRIADVNEILCRTLGFQRDELLDLEMPWPFTPPEGLEVSYAMASRMTAEALSSGYSEPIELPLMRKDGSRFMGEVIISPARDAAGEIGRSLAVAILDLDGFKTVNDRHGHPAGDRALCEVARRLQHVLRRGDLLARVGGEEFAWILPEVHSHGVWAAVERARQAIGGQPFEAVGPLTISVGVALRDGLENGKQLYQHADQSLYRAKHEGRDRCIMWQAG